MRTRNHHSSYATSGRGSTRRARELCAWLLAVLLPIQAIASATAPVWRPAHYHQVESEPLHAPVHPALPAQGPRPGASFMHATHEAVPARLSDPRPAEVVAASEPHGDASFEAGHRHRHQRGDDGPHDHAHAGETTQPETAHAHPHVAAHPLTSGSVAATKAAAPTHARHHHGADGIGHHRHGADSAEVVYLAGWPDLHDPLFAGGRGIPLAGDGFNPLPPAWALRLASSTPPSHQAHAAASFRSQLATPLLRPPRRGVTLAFGH